MYEKGFQDYLQKELSGIQENGLFKEEWAISSPQGAKIIVDGKTMLNFCANNYLGLANDWRLKIEAISAILKRGYGLASVRFICGTQDIHKELEKKISEFLIKEDTILYSSCAAANEGIFEVLLNHEDAVISDWLNHATIIDGIRLWQRIHAKKLPDGRYELPTSRVYKHMDMDDLEKGLRETKDKRFRVIVTDGVFSMDGDIAPLKEICGLAEKYNALVMVDDSHATGFIGKTGRGTPEYCGVMNKVDIITSTMGKALGGAAGGFVSAKKEIVEILRQRSRPYLFSNTLPAVIVAVTIKVLDMIKDNTELRDKLETNTTYFRKKIRELGFDVRTGTHPIVPIMLYDAKKAAEMAIRLKQGGIYVKAFSYPVVPEGQARIRVQVSAAHTRKDLDSALEKFAKVKNKPQS
ncbi:MAG: glycine C-acetyltransferase [Candidatus Nealsonbacteria bacterium]|nr:glycine C-acetyltransferase [Candidatus Nealsonbacteria bacterium]